MRIARIKVRNFRSIKEVEMTPSSFNILIGQNNHGKTNFFEAIDWFYGAKGDIEKIRFGQQGTEEVSVEIEFVGAQEGASKMKNEKKRTLVKSMLGESDSIVIKRTSLDQKVRKIFNPTTQQWLEKNPLGIDPALNHFLPMFEYVSTELNPLEVSKYGSGKKTPIANMLSGVLTAILEQDEK